MNQMSKNQLKLSSLEKELNFKFPEDYKEFIIVDNGQFNGRSFEISPLKGQTLFHYFFNINVDSTDNILEVRKTLPREYDEFMMIGLDQGGSYIAFKIFEGEKSNIYFLDYYENDNAIKIADSFEDFLRKLKPVIIEDDLERILRYGCISDLKEYLKNIGEDYYTIDKNGRTLLERSVIYMNLNLVNYLISYFSEDIRSKSLQIAKENSIFFEGYDEIIKLLENRKG